MTIVLDKPKYEIIDLVDSQGTLEFDYWYKGNLVYSNESFVVSIKPEYRDWCNKKSSLETLLSSEDYDHVYVFKGVEKPYDWEWYKEGELI